jgi:cyanobactin maturation PatA/PatG family protease
LKALWAETLGDPRIRVAVLDGPVDRSHRCFDGAELTSLPTLVPDIAGSGRMSAHGTHITSMIFGQPGSPVRGIAPSCRGFIAPVFSDNNPGPASQLDLARAINQAIGQGAHVINISGGELSETGEADPMLVNAVRSCKGERVLIVAAAGNDACRCLHVPAALSSVLAVGAMDAQGRPLDSSNWGEVYQTQGILAPGENMLGAVPGGGTALKSGTSFATPVVTGMVALLLSLQLNRGEKPDPYAVREALLASAIPCDEALFADCQRFLAGRLNILGAHALISRRRRTSMSDERIAGDKVSPNDANPADPGPVQGITGQEETEKPAGYLLPPSDVPRPSSETRGVQAAAAAGAPESVVDVTSGPIPLPRGAANGAATSSVRASNVVAAEACGCQANGPKQLVYAIGVLGYDFGTEARRDGFKQLMPRVTAEGIPFLPEPGRPPAAPPYPPNPYDARQIVHYLGGYPPPDPPFPTQGGFPTLKGSPAFSPPVPPPPDHYPGFPAHLSEAAHLIWTLNIELTPIYAIRPGGTFATETYQRLVEFLAGQVRDADDKHYISRVSIPAVMTGETVQLFSG